MATSGESSRTVRVVDLHDLNRLRDVDVLRVHRALMVVDGHLLPSHREYHFLHHLKSVRCHLLMLLLLVWFSLHPLPAMTHR